MTPNARTVAQQIIEQKVVAAISAAPDNLNAVAKAYLDGGGRVLEYTFRDPDFSRNIAAYRGLVEHVRELGIEHSLVGAGSIVTEEQVSGLISLEADYLPDLIVSPCWSEVVWEKCLEKGILYIGAGQTPQEIFDIWQKHDEAGEKYCIVKVFNAQTIAPKTLKGSMAPFASRQPAISTLISGGVSPTNVKDWFQLGGASAIAVGSGFFPPNDLDSWTGNVAAAVAAAEAAV